MPELKHTPLNGYYNDNQVKLVDFGGWAMPMQFTSIMKEHEAVRERVGLFDCSHMGEIFVSGPDAESYLNSLLTNNVARIEDGGVQYNVLCQEDGGSVDDVMVYRKNSNLLTVVCNASNTDKVWDWMNQHVQGDVTLENISDTVGLIAVQGPLAEETLQELTNFDLATIKRHRMIEGVQIAEIETIISRTGYTGEDGFEVYVDAENTRTLWEKILTVAEAKGGMACGLGARDTLRLEAGLPLYGQELSADISPLMAGLGFAVKTKKAADFIGKDSLRKQKENGLEKQIVGFKLTERGIPRHGYSVFSQEGEQIGKVTSGTQSPTLKQGIGMALVKASHAEIGTPLMIEIRNKQVAAEVVKKPFI